MNKGLKGFLIGFFIVLVIAVVVTLVMASQHQVTFIEEISSWFKV